MTKLFQMRPLFLRNIFQGVCCPPVLISFRRPRVEIQRLCLDGHGEGNDLCWGIPVRLDPIDVFAGGETSFNWLKNLIFFKSFSCEHLRRHPTSPANSTVDQGRFCSIDFVQPFVKFSDGNQFSNWDVPCSIYLPAAERTKA